MVNDQVYNVLRCDGGDQGLGSKDKSHKKQSSQILINYIN